MTQIPTRGLLRTVAVVAVVLAAALPAAAQEPEPLPESAIDRLAEVRRRAAETALQIDILTATRAEVQEQLAVVSSWVHTQEQIVAGAQQDLVDATIAAADAVAAEEAKAAELEVLEELMAEIAVEAFMSPPQVASLDILLTKDLSQAEKADVMLRSKAEHDRDIADELAAAERSLERLRLQAEETRRDADAAADRAATQLAELTAARDAQAQFAAQLSADIDATVTDLSNLELAEFEAAVAVQEEARALLARSVNVTSVEVARVREFTVNAAIARNLELMLEAAEADGIILGGWGHRSTEQQIALRRQHCGGEGIDDTTAVYGVPAGSCSPPTAKPGTSMHEIGLAIDFTHAGASINSHGSPAYKWLAEHAYEYGFHNLPSEPWHWSVNGS